MKYFYKESTGLNADIKRHRDEEERLIAVIAKLEAEENNENNLAFIKSYRNSLIVLQQSKAELLTKLGRK